MTHELLVDLDEAARRLGICRRSVQGLIYSGALPGVRIGRSRRVLVADLEFYVRELRQQNDREGSLAVVSGGGHWHGLAQE